MSQQRPPRRPAAGEPDELEGSLPHGRQAWIALFVMAVVLAVVVGSGLLIKHATDPIVPSALAGCTTSTQIASHEFIGRQPMCIIASQKLQATVTTTQGDVVIQLHPEVAPVSVNNFVVLALHGYYNGLSFWKAEDWVVQGGDPRGDGRGGPGYTLPEEPSGSPWDPGAVGMARVPGGPVNGSQFFIVKTSWPGSGPTAVYNRFGTVTSGLDKAQVLSVTDTIIAITIKVS
ncbi:MAG TPA: peptidylprolyl isomerase [Candidatus Dormibacteraeota bacterium]|nr:peptidylprolyl isomerase [Candidatus Dormibacteraeota bacterium]